MAGPWPVRPQTAEAWRRGYSITVALEAYTAGRRLDLPLDVLGGSVTETDAPGVRSVLDVEVASARGLWDALSPLGTVLVPTVTTWYGVASEAVRMGTFSVEEQSLTYDGAGVLKLRCPDLWSKVIGHRLERPVQPRGNVVEIAAAHVRAAVGADLTGQVITASPARTGGALIFERDRDELVQTLLAAANRVGYLDRAARLVIEPPPTLRGPGTWEVDPFAGGVLIAATRTRSRARIYNRVVVNPAGTARFPTVVVDDTDPRSPTRVTGPMGVRPVFVANPFIRTGQQARVVAKTRLQRTTMLAADVEVDAAPHYGLTPGTVVPVVLPAQNGDGATAERHLVASVVHPFPRRGQDQAPPQQLTLRSSRPEGGDDGDDEDVAA